MSLSLLERVSLKPYNSFGLDVSAQWYAEARDDDQVLEALQLARQRGFELLVLGGGSNLLLTKDVDGLVLRIASQGLRLIRESAEQVVVEAEAGESWHPFVLWTLQQGLQGLENLSLIPGTVGAAPMQNIGAYGVEIKGVFAGLTAINRQTGEVREFALAECCFGYRDSLFKQQPGRWLILRVRFALKRTGDLYLDYGPLRQRLRDMAIENPTAIDVSRAVCSIRSEKLPDPARLGNAGSFFKNPLVSESLANELGLRFPGLAAYPAKAGRVKLAAGWLIERAGWKGFREGDAGIHALQALVLVNYGAATGNQLLALARKVQADIYSKFGVELEIEPNVL